MDLSIDTIAYIKVKSKATQNERFSYPVFSEVKCMDGNTRKYNYKTFFFNKDINVKCYMHFLQN